MPRNRKRKPNTRLWLFLARRTEDYYERMAKAYPKEEIWSKALSDTRQRIKELEGKKE